MSAAQTCAKIALKRTHSIYGDFKPLALPLGADEINSKDPDRWSRNLKVHFMLYNLTRGKLRKPADAGLVNGLSARLGFALPSDYLDFLRQHDGGMGFVADRYIVLWRAEDLADFNREYEVEKYAPGILLFGSNGGGEGYGFDTQAAEAMLILRIPFIGMQRRYAIQAAKTLSDLLAQPFGYNMSNGSTDTLSRDMELVEIKPIILGGSPTDPQNKMAVTRQQHFELVRYWNRVISKQREYGRRSLE